MSETGPTAAEIERILDRIPDAFAGIEEGRAQALRGEGIPLDALDDQPVPKTEHA